MCNLLVMGKFLTRQRCARIAPKTNLKLNDIKALKMKTKEVPVATIKTPVLGRGGGAPTQLFLVNLVFEEFFLPDTFNRKDWTRV